MERKNNMEILNEIRNLRNNQLKNFGDNSTSVVRVEELGKGKITGDKIYRLLEEKNVENELTGEYEQVISELFYKYKDEPVLVAIKNDETEQEIVPIGKDGDLDSKWNVQKEEIEQCLEEREKELKAIAKSLGIEENEINSLSEIDLQQKIEENSQENNEEEKEIKDDEPKQLSEEEVKTIGLTGMNEINLNAQVDTKGTSLGNVLNLGSEYSKLFVVHSYKLAELSDSEGKQGKVNNVRFGLVAQKSDGTYETIPESKLAVYRGGNREVTKIDNREDIETSHEDCIFEVPGTNKKLIVDQKDPYGIPEVYLSQDTRDNDGNMAQKLQDQYSGTDRTDVEVRALFNANKGIDQTNKMHDEMKEHERAGCNDIDLEEVNGNLEDGHIHFDPDNVEQQNAIEEIMEQGKVSKEEAENKLERILENNKDINLEEAKEEAIEEINDEYRGIDSRGV